MLPDTQRALSGADCRGPKGTTLTQTSGELPTRVVSCRVGTMKCSQSNCLLQSSAAAEFSPTGREVPSSAESPTN
jgi:hypothetical protein